MGWLSELFGLTSPPPAPPGPELRLGGDASLDDSARLDRQIARFSRALAQCEKPAKRRELQAWLDYFANLKSARRKLEASR